MSAAAPTRAHTRLPPGRHHENANAAGAGVIDPSAPGRDLEAVAPGGQAGEAGPRLVRVDEIVLQADQAIAIAHRRGSRNVRPDQENVSERSSRASSGWPSVVRRRLGVATSVITTLGGGSLASGSLGW